MLYIRLLTSWITVQIKINKECISTFSYVTICLLWHEYASSDLPCCLNGVNKHPLYCSQLWKHLSTCVLLLCASVWCDPRAFVLTRALSQWMFLEAERCHVKPCFHSRTDQQFTQSFWRLSKEILLHSETSLVSKDVQFMWATGSITHSLEFPLYSGEMITLKKISVVLIWTETDRGLVCSLPQQ